MPKEFQRNNLAPWFKLEASCLKRGRPHTTFPWSLQGTYRGTPSDATLLTLGYLGQFAVEECCVFVWYCWNLNYAILCYVFCKTNEGARTEQQLFFGSLNRVVVLGLVVWLVQAFLLSWLTKTRTLWGLSACDKTTKAHSVDGDAAFKKNSDYSSGPIKEQQELFFMLTAKFCINHRAITCNDVINTPKRTATPRLLSSSFS